MGLGPKLTPSLTAGPSAQVRLAAMRSGRVGSPADPFLHDGAVVAGAAGSNAVW